MTAPALHLSYKKIISGKGTMSGSNTHYSHFTNTFYVSCKLKMTLPVIYISLYLLTVVLFFIERDWTVQYKKKLISAHSVMLLLLLVDIFVINLKGVWLDRIIVLGFLLTASATFSLYRKTLKRWQKFYFGLFFVYPAITAATFLIDRIMFVVIASPLLLSLTVPETKFSNQEYELREVVGSIVPVQLALVKKGVVTEKHVGTSNDEEITYGTISGLKIVSVANDTTRAIVTSNNRKYEVAFYK